MFQGTFFVCIATQGTLTPEVVEATLKEYHALLSEYEMSKIILNHVCGTINSHTGKRDYCVILVHLHAMTLGETRTLLWVFYDLAYDVADYLGTHLRTREA